MRREHELNLSEQWMDTGVAAHTRLEVVASKATAMMVNIAAKAGGN
jgi:hypothetical protein